MYPIEMYIEALKKYIYNHARLEGSIAEGYVVSEALTLQAFLANFIYSRRTEAIFAHGKMPYSTSATKIKS